MLPDSIQTEIFTLSSAISDAVVDYLCEILEDSGYLITAINNFDSALVIYLQWSSVIAELRIDRILRQFEVVARCGDYTILPCCGDWGNILEYLAQLQNGI